MPAARAAALYTKASISHRFLNVRRILSSSFTTKRTTTHPTTCPSGLFNVRLGSNIFVRVLDNGMIRWSNARGNPAPGAIQFDATSGNGLIGDVQNTADPQAIALRTETNALVGFCPTYLVGDSTVSLQTQPRWSLPSNDSMTAAGCEVSKHDPPCKRC